MNGLMARLWAPSWKCWASALDSQQKLHLSQHCPEASKKGLPSPGSYQNGTKICSPNPSQGGGFPNCLPALPSLPSRILHGFPNAQKPQKWDPNYRNTSKIEPKVLPKVSLKRSSKPFWKKRAHVEFDPLFTIYSAGRPPPETDRFPCIWLPKM